MFFTRTILLTIFSLFLTNSLEAANKNHVHPAGNVTNLTPYMYFFEDTKGSMTIEQVSSPDFRKNFIANKNAGTPFWLNKSAIWGKVDLQLNNSARDFYLYLDNPYIANLDIFLPSRHGEFLKLSTGHDIPVNKRLYPDRKLIIPIHSHSGALSQFSEGTIYFRSISPQSEYTLDTYLVTDIGLNHEIGLDILYLGGYFGIVLVMAIYNFIIFLTLRNRSYLYYVIYIILFALTMASGQGITRDYFFYNFNFDMWFVGILCIMTLIAGNLFCINFLELRTNFPGIIRFFNIINIILPLILIFKLLNNEIFSNIFFAFLVICVILTLISCFRLYRKLPFTRDFLHAWLIMLVSQILYTVATTGVYIPYVNLFTLQGAHAIETVLLALALARRISYLQDEKKRFQNMQKDLAFAEEIQKYLFPRDLPESKHYTVAGRYLPSASLSGDFYDFVIDKKNTLHLLMVDVAGHGYAAALVASMVKVAFHETRKKSKNVKNHQVEINRILSKHVQHVFVTALNLKIEPLINKFHLVRSGHTPALHYIRKSREIREYSPTGMPLGILNDYSCEEISISYSPGDRLIFFTDGIIEELNSIGEEFGIENLKTEIQNNIDRSPEDFCDTLVRTISSWKGILEQVDDITFFIIDLH